jgi:hypothetical protein
VTISFHFRVSAKYVSPTRTVARLARRVSFAKTVTMKMSLKPLQAPKKTAKWEVKVTQVIDATNSTLISAQKAMQLTQKSDRVSKLVILNLPRLGPYEVDNSAVVVKMTILESEFGSYGNGDEAEERSHGWYVGKVKRQLASAVRKSTQIVPIGLHSTNWMHKPLASKLRSQATTSIRRVCCTPFCDFSF